MSGKVSKFFLSKFMGWLLFAIAGFYFLFSINTKRVTKLEEETGKKFSFFQRVWNSIEMPRLKLGIDLQGGTYLVVGVEVEKAIVNKLNTESKSLDGLFKKNNIKVLPTSKVVKDTTLFLSFPEEEAAKIVYNLLKRECPTLKISISGTDVKATLTSSEEQRIKTGSVEQAVNVLTNRLGGFGVEGIVVQQHGDKQVVVQLPGVNDPERVKSVITKTAHLDFKIVEKTAGSKQALLDDFGGNSEDLPSDKMIIPGKSERGDEDEGGRWYLVSAYADVSGEHIVDSRVSYGEFNKLEVSFRLDSTGAVVFKDLTGNNIGKQLAIVVDDVVFSAPNIQSAIGAQGRITGNYTTEDANDLALVLRSGALQAPLKFEQETRVGASLGQDSIREGFTACLIALFLICLVSLLFYRMAGIFAIFALMYNIFLILLCLSYFQSSLTLSGIAGMVLTIGMAIDASVLIYERIKEELAAGSTYRKSLTDGFSGAMGVILDSNITTFLTGLVLFKFGGPAVKGFAVTLMIGIIATILTGIWFLRSMFDLVSDFFGKEIKF